MNSDKTHFEPKISQQSSSEKDSDKFLVSGLHLRRFRRTQTPCSSKQAVTNLKTSSDSPVAAAKGLNAKSEEFEMDPLENDPTTFEEHCHPSEQTHDEGMANQERRKHGCGTTEVQDDSWPLSEKPYFHIMITKSNLRSSFLLMIPSKMQHILPGKEVPVMLTCRNKTWTMSYYGDRATKRFDRKWKDFASDNNLRIGDGCVFELLECTEELVKFRVKILSGDIPAVFLDRIDGKTPNNPILIQ